MYESVKRGIGEWEKYISFLPFSHLRFIMLQFNYKRGTKMKKLVIVAVTLVMVMGLAGSASAAGAKNAGAKGINVGMGNSAFGDTGLVRITGKYFFDRDMAFLAGFGFQATSGDYDVNVFSFQVGLRKYLGTGDFAPFVGGRISYETREDTTSGTDEDAIDLMGEFGGEYFFSKQFSMEGSIGIGFGTVENNNTNADYTYFGTRTVGVSANFYF